MTLLNIIRDVCLASLASRKHILWEDIAGEAGVEPGNLARLLKGKHVMKVTTLIRLADALGYDVTLTQRVKK
jgi:transcriptional regulator with XRE-family HTH domain